MRSREDRVTDSTKRAKGVDSARRVLQILLSFSEGTPEITVEQIAQEFDISMPSAYRYVSLLRELFLIEEKARGVYTLTSQVYRLADIAESSIDVASAGRPILEQLVAETGATALLLKRMGDSAMCVASSMPEAPATISFTPGHLMPLDRGAGPKVLLAAMSLSRREKYFKTHLSHRSEKSRNDLASAVAQVSEAGFAISEAEVDEGTYAVAAPVTIEGRTVATLSIAEFAFRLDDSGRANLLEAVQLGATAVSRALERPTE